MSHYYKKNIQEVAQELQTDPQKGISQDEYKKRIKEYGRNELAKGKQKSLLGIFIDQFKSFMVLILIIAAIVSGITGYIHGEGLLDTWIILGILIINAVIGTYQEMKAKNSLEALSKMASPHTKVIRDGKVYDVPASDIVPGDVVALDAGDIIPADIRLTESANLKIEESSLTGESVPVEKQIAALSSEHDDIPLGDRNNMAFSTGMVTYGRGKGIVVATGMDTEVGHIARLLDSTDKNETPMTKRLEHLGKVLGYTALGICAFIFLIGVLYGRPMLDMLMTAVSLAVAAIPEGLQVISTIVLAMGVQRMVKVNAIVRTLPSVETLGCATVICSDKTGTLTQNRMTVVATYLPGNPIEKDLQKTHQQQDLLFKAAVLCNDAHLTSEDGEHKTTGDPTETALIEAGLKVGIHKNDLEEASPRIAEVSFDSDRKRMSTANKLPNDPGSRVYVKGGLDEMLEVCSQIIVGKTERPLTDEDIQAIHHANIEMASEALRVLAFAYKDLPNSEREEDIEEELERELTFIGLLGMIDPARPEATEAVAKCKEAGIKTVMITGDHKETAIAIAKEIGIYSESDNALTGIDLEKMTDDELFDVVQHTTVYARVAPEHKVRIVKAFQGHKQVVAMTGDGVNDAPSLKQADIGTAMGIVGTEVAKDAADIVLTDDNFATIVRAVEEGRRIYTNIVKSIQFLLSTNIGELFLILIAAIFDLGIPLLAIHILWINLVTDSLPAIAISLDPAEKDIMKRPPRNNEAGFFTKGMIWRTLYQGTLVSLVALASYFIGSKVDLQGATLSSEALGRTMAFTTIVFAQLIHVRNLHSNTESSFRFNPFKNIALLGALIISFLMMIPILLVPSLRSIFKLVELDGIHWLIVIGLAIVPTIFVELFKLLKINTIKGE